MGIVWVQLATLGVPCHNKGTPARFLPSFQEVGNARILKDSVMRFFFYQGKKISGGEKITIAPPPPNKKIAVTILDLLDLHV